jgi:hypothetical protein
MSIQPSKRLLSATIWLVASSAACASATDHERGERARAMSEADTKDTWQLEWFGALGQRIVNGTSVVRPFASLLPAVVFYADSSDPGGVKLRWTWLTGEHVPPNDIALSSDIASGPSAVLTDVPGVARVFYGDSSGRLWYVDVTMYDFPFFGGGSLNPPTPQLLSGPGLLASAPSAIYQGNNTYSVFYRGANGHLTESRHVGTDPWWGAPIDLGTPAASAPSAIYRPSSGNINLFYTTTNGKLGESWFDGTSWAYVGDHGLAATASAPTALVSPDETRVDVFFQAPWNNPRFALFTSFNQQTWTSTAGWGSPIERTTDLFPPYAAWDPQHVLGTDYVGELASASPREVRITRTLDLVTPQGTETFGFSQSRSTGITGSSIPADIHDSGNATSALVSFDPNADLLIFDMDSSGAGFRAPSFLDLNPPFFPQWRLLPYTYDGRGPAQTVDLKDWNLWGNRWGAGNAGHMPIRTIRSYDHGVCWAHVGLNALASRFLGAFNKFPGPLTDCTGARFSIEVGVGAMLATADVSDTLATGALSDQLFWDIQISGDARVTFSPGICGPFGLGVDTRMTHGIYIDQPTGGPPGAARVALSDFVVIDGGALGLRSPGSDEGMFNTCQGLAWNTDSCLLRGFPKELLSQINSSFVIPQIGGWISQPLPLSPADIPLLPTCKTDADCTNVGPEDGCFFPQMPYKLIGSAVASFPVNKALADQNIGVCVNRLEPKRVNIRPDGVDIVLIDDARDKQTGLVRLLAPRSGGTVQCASAPPSPTDPINDLLFETMHEATQSAYIRN